MFDEPEKAYKYAFYLALMCYIIPELLTAKYMPEGSIPTLRIIF
jgi:hypothetical protein